MKPIAFSGGAYSTMKSPYSSMRAIQRAAAERQFLSW